MRRLTLGTQLALLAVGAVVLLQSMSLTIDRVAQRNAMISNIRDQSAAMLLEIWAAVERAPNDRAASVALSFSTAPRVALVEAGPGIKPGDTVLPERSAAVGAWLARRGVPTEGFRMAERIAWVPARPPGVLAPSARGLSLNAAVPMLLDGSQRSDGPPARPGGQRWVRGPSPERPDTEEDLRRTRVFIFEVPRADGRWLNLYVMAPPMLAWGPTLWKAAATGVAALLVLVLVLLTARRVLRPVRRLVAAADALGRGERATPVPAGGAADVAEVAAAFNRMSERVAQATDYQVGLLRSLGHDLKGPLAAIRVLLERAGPAETRAQIEARVARAQALIDAIMGFTRATLRDGPMEETDLAALVELVVEEQAELGHDATHDLPDRLFVRVRTAAMERALRNLVENAVRHGGAVHVRLRAGDGVVVEVEDRGPGIPEASMEEVFEPFARLTEAPGGAGLGLAIVRSIVVDHGGTVALANRAGGGLIVTVTLPR